MGAQVLSRSFEQERLDFVKTLKELKELESEAPRLLDSTINMQLQSVRGRTPALEQGFLRFEVASHKKS
jgi:hypothetical protein